jgi:hypothetical protein
VIAEFTEYDESELQVFAATEFDKVVKEAENREQKEPSEF